jgi:hypothetical protein
LLGDFELLDLGNCASCLPSLDVTASHCCDQQHRSAPKRQITETTNNTHNDNGNDKNKECCQLHVVFVVFGLSLSRLYVALLLRRIDSRNFSTTD